RRLDLNQRPPGYEPGELPLLHAAPGKSRPTMTVNPAGRSDPSFFIISHESSACRTLARRHSDGHVTILRLFLSRPLTPFSIMDFLSPVPVRRNVGARPVEDAPR